MKVLMSVLSLPSQLAPSSSQKRDTRTGVCDHSNFVRVRFWKKKRNSRQIGHFVRIFVRTFVRFVLEFMSLLQVFFKSDTDKMDKTSGSHNGSSRPGSRELCFSSIYLIYLFNLIGGWGRPLFRKLNNYQII